MDLVLVIDPRLVLIREDGMQHVFDYDPLLEQIDAISRDRRYETQEMLASEVARCCAKFKQIEGIEVCLKKLGLASMGALSLARSAFGWLSVELIWLLCAIAKPEAQSPEVHL